MRRVSGARKCAGAACASYAARASVLPFTMFVPLPPPECRCQVILAVQRCFSLCTADVTPRSDIDYHTLTPLRDSFDSISYRRYTKRPEMVLSRAVAAGRSGSYAAGSACASFHAYRQPPPICALRRRKQRRCTLAGAFASTRSASAPSAPQHAASSHGSVTHLRVARDAPSRAAKWN